MSIILDQTYTNLIAARLDLFSWVRDRLGLCRCPYCGDSEKKRTKRRFYIYQDTKHNKNHLSVMCHNCGHSNSFYHFLQDFAPDVFQSYRLELFKENGRAPARDKAIDIKGLGRFKPGQEEAPKEEPKPVSTRKAVETEVIPDHLAMSVDRLPYNHPVVRYVAWRRIPEAQWPRLYYTDHFKDFIFAMDMAVQEDTELPNDPRLLIPFFDEWGKLICVQGRAMEKDAGIRYITIKKHEDSRKIFGLERLDKSRVKMVVEGPIDSLFLPNCVATADANLLSAEFGDIYIPDNQPRNRGVINSMERIIAAGKKIVIWPPSVSGYKDINDMIKEGGMTTLELLRIISQNHYQGMSAKMQFTKYKRI